METTLKKVGDRFIPATNDTYYDLDDVAEACEEACTAWPKGGFETKREWFFFVRHDVLCALSITGPNEYEYDPVLRQWDITG
jgi:hypothetical protein